MLKITVDTGKTHIRVKLEGRLAGDWVRQLENVWHSIQVMNHSVETQVDLQGVTYVDVCARQLLRRIHQEGGVFIAHGCMIKVIIDEVKDSMRYGREDVLVDAS